MLFCVESCFIYYYYILKYVPTRILYLKPYYLGAWSVGNHCVQHPEVRVLVEGHGGSVFEVWGNPHERGENSTHIHPGQFWWGSNPGVLTTEVPCYPSLQHQYFQVASRPYTNQVQSSLDSQIRKDQACLGESGCKQCQSAWCLQ